MTDQEKKFFKKASYLIARGYVNNQTVEELVEHLKEVELKEKEASLKRLNDK